MLAPNTEGDEAINVEHGERNEREVEQDDILTAANPLPNINQNGKQFIKKLI